MAVNKSKKAQKGNRPKENWPSATKSIALKAIEKGQLVHLGILTVAGLIVWRMESEDVARIMVLLIDKPIFAIIGWGLFVITAMVMVLLLRGQRNMYLSEIERISSERNHWQESACQNIQASGYEVT